MRDTASSTMTPIAAPDEVPQPVLSVVDDLDAQVRAGNLEGFQPVQTGFPEIDAAIGGGFRPGQLVLLSGSAGVGKTSLTLQMARNIAMNNGVSLFVCYEHETEYLAQRLISMESIGSLDTTMLDGLRLKDINEIVIRFTKLHPHAGFTEAVKHDPRGERALKKLARYGENLLLVKGSSYTTGVDALAGMVWQARKRIGTAQKPIVLFVDYLQKVASSTPHTEETARSIEEIEGLKELALEQKIIVVAIVAAEVEGLKVQRMRLQHILSSAAIAYEADVIMLMNEKHDIVDRRHIDYNRYNAEQFHHYIVLSIEKNRSGSDLVDLEMRKQLQFCQFKQDPRRVEEHLI